MQLEYCTFVFLFYTALALRISCEGVFVLCGYQWDLVRCSLRWCSEFHPHILAAKRTKGLMLREAVGSRKFRSRFRREVIQWEV